MSCVADDAGARLNALITVYPAPTQRRWGNDKHPRLHGNKGGNACIISLPPVSEVGQNMPKTVQNDQKQCQPPLWSVSSRSNASCMTIEVQIQKMHHGRPDLEPSVAHVGPF